MHRARCTARRCYSFIAMVTSEDNRRARGRRAAAPHRRRIPSPRGNTMLAKREWVRTHADHLRRALMLEPRGHADMYGAILTEPVAPGSHAGVLFMHNEGYSTMCGHGVDRGDDDGAGARAADAGRRRHHDRLRLARGDDSGPGEIRAGGAGEAGRAGRVGRVESVSFLNVPSFVLHGGLTVKLASRTIRADVAFGGAFYAIVDSEAVGLPIDAAHLPELRRVGMEIKHAIEAAHTVVHPLDPGLERDLRHDLHRSAERRGRRSAQRHHLRRRGSRSVAVRHRHRRGDGGHRRDGTARRPTGRSCTRA